MTKMSVGQRKVGSFLDDQRESYACKDSPGRVEGIQAHPGLVLLETAVSVGEKQRKRGQ